MDYLINIVGEDQVGIGTDWVQDHNISFFEYLQKDKGNGRYVTPPYKEVPPMPYGISKLSQFQNFIPAMERAGWSTSKIENFRHELVFIFRKSGNKNKLLIQEFYLLQLTF